MPSRTRERVTNPRKYELEKRTYTEPSYLYANVSLGDYTPTNTKPHTSIEVAGVTVDLSSVRYQSTRIAGVYYYVYNLADVQVALAAVSSQIIANCQAAHAAWLLTIGTPEIVSFTVSDDYHQMTDIVTPDFTKRSRNGEIINSPMSSTKWSFNSSFAADLGHFKSEVYLDTMQTLASKTCIRVWFSASGVKMPGMIPSEVAQAISGGVTLGNDVDVQAVINEAWAKVQEGEFQLPVFLAELPKTVQHLAYTASRIYSIYRAIRKGDFKKLAPQTYRKWKRASATGKVELTLDLISSAWLEARYAWRPLLLDCQKAVKVLLDKTEKPERKTFRSSTVEMEEEEVNWQVSSAGFLYTVTGSLRKEVVVRAGVLTQITADAQLSNQLGLSNVVGTVWELIPYSFVVDWFLNVSGLIANLNPQGGVEALSSWSTIRKVSHLSGTVVVTRPGYSGSKTLKFSASRESYARTPSTGATYVNFDVNLDVAKLLDAAALLWRLR